MQNSPLILVAILEAKEGRQDFVKAEIVKLLTPTRAEEGCIEYTLHSNNKNPHVFVIHEIWTDYASWQQHIQSSHLQAFGKAVNEAIKEKQILELTRCAE